MSATDFVALNARFAIPGHVTFKEGPGGLAVAEVSNSHAASTIALQGAHVMTYQRHSEAPVLWLSKFAKFAPGKSIRGGVPVCWPWFGPHATDAKLPAHGYARTVMWQILETGKTADGGTLLRFGLEVTDATRAMWPHDTPVELQVIVGSTLQVDLVTRNDGPEPVVLGEALHTYFHIGDVASTAISGLDQTAYLDKVADFARKVQTGPVRIAGEVDRLYVDTEETCTIEDEGLGRRIVIAKAGSRSTVVWNPWIEKAEKMGDFGPDGYRGMVCVETVNAADNVVTLVPGETHRLRAVISVEALK